MKIFVQIASYRDPDLVNTIADLYLKAKNPKSINVGLCHQYGDDAWDNPSIFTNRDNIKTISIDHKDSKGACWARSITQTLWQQEEFTLQIDSHSRFEPNWDDNIVQLFNSQNDAKTVFTAYPSMFTPGQNYEQFDKNIYTCHVYGMKNGFISARPKHIKDRSKPVIATAVAAGFIFASSSIISDVKYDPEFYFTGEEAALALRLFTNGYNLYHPNINTIYHYYTRKEQKKHWSDHKDHYQYTKKSHDRLNCLLKRNDNYKNIDTYGLGSDRTIEDWRVYSGIDYINKKLHKDSIEGNYPPYKDQPELWISEQEINEKK
jgi:hypothetical protein